LGFRVSQYPKPEKVTDECPLESLELNASKPFLNPLISIKKKNQQDNRRKPNFAT